MDDRHLEDAGMDIRYLKPEFIAKEQKKMKVEITILKKLVAQLTDKAQKQETQIDALTMSLAESNCQKCNDFKTTQDIKINGLYQDCTQVLNVLPNA